MKESRRITPLRTILQNCLNHIENLETNRSICDNYDKEFQNLKQFSETLKIQKEYSCTEGEKEVNRKKNRYKDILPFNISRVVLSEYAGIPGSDYINANYIKGASGSPAYIASQGPLPNTVDDFWRMVVECEVQVIVMACNAQESGKHKCENYWVEKEGEEKRFGMVRICLVKASTVCPDFLVRTMRLKYTNDKDVIEERTICQFHYSAWPDHGVPPLVRPLLDMVRLMRDTQASETLPVLVHCSAGCGRTGTICAIDFVWGLLRAGKLTEEFSLFNLVKDMRKQRVAMVQTKEQYILVHQAVRELFEEQLRVIESHPYENIDFNGVPLIKDLDEPFYETISVRNEENCEEKQDKSEGKEKGEDSDLKINKISNAPPLPRKKRANVLFSKQEKEAENLTEKNRIFFAEKEREKTDATLSSLLGKPRIVKLRALFEKSPSLKDRTAMKDRGSQTVSRSLSLGAIRKPLPAEILESYNEKNKPSCSTSQSSQSSQSDIAQLKHSKSFSKSVPLIKRSKSLKTFNQSSRLIISPANDRTKKSLGNSPKVQETDSNLKNADESFPLQSKTSKTLSQETQHLNDCSKRRRSLESLMGDIPFTITWPTTVMIMEKCSSHTGKQICNCTTKSEYQKVQNYKNVELLRQSLQHLSLETDKKINNIVTGIGIRERRNSFRQAVTKNDVYNVFENCQQCKCLNNTNSNDFLSTLNSEVNNSLNMPSQFSDYGSDAKYLELDTTTQAKTIVKKIQNTADENKLKLQKQQCSTNAGPLVNKIITKDPYQQDTSSPTNSNLLQPRACQVKPKNLRPCEDFEKNMESKNLFLKKLNSEILSEREKEAGHNFQESNIRYLRSYEDSDKLTSHIVYGSTVVNSNFKKPLHKTNFTLTKSHNAKADMIDETDNSSHKNIKSVEIEKTEKGIQPSKNANFQNHHLYIQFQRPVKSVERYEKCSNAPIPQPSFYHRTGHVTVDSFGHRSSTEISQAFRRNEQPISINQSDPQHKDSYLPIPHIQNVSSVNPNTLHPSLKSIDFSGNYCKNSKVSDLDFYDKNKPKGHSDKKYTLPTEVADKSNKNFSSWSHSPPCRSCDSSLSDQPSTKSESSRLSKQQEPTYFTEQDKKNIKKIKQVSELNKNYVNDFAKVMHNSESYISTRKQKKSDEMVLKTSSNFSNQGNNLQQNMSKHSKDDFILEEPVAPPRIKRHASVIVPRNNLNGANNVSLWISAENKNRSNRNSTLQADETSWNDSFGIDLDAVAASLEKDKRESSVLNKIKSTDNHSKITVNANPQKKQHYF